MKASTPMLDEVLRLAQQLSLADQARLIAHIASAIAASLEAQSETSLDAQRAVGSTQLPAESRAAMLARDPNSALAKVLALTPDGYIPPTDEDIAQWREERLNERYGL